MPAGPLLAQEWELWLATSREEALRCRVGFHCWCWDGWEEKIGRWVRGVRNGEMALREQNCGETRTGAGFATVLKRTHKNQHRLFPYLAIGI